ncbi:MAG: aminotransferase class III-fold pyridoxal phosphate-dependent enzyme, partial [Gammaproteobacteria bacterium]|nr:aminotransferase class III-fold pyridoxal phosphate-dependent enzyme [Gammaproteobacteria bacterium]
AFGGKRSIMEHIAPLGPVYQAGTLSGNPVAMSAGLAMLKAISTPGFHDSLAVKVTTLCEGIQTEADKHDIAFTSNRIGGMFGWFFTDNKSVTNFEQSMSCNLERFKKFYHLMLEQGIYLAPSAYEAGFISAAHGEKELRLTIDAAGKAFSAL